MANKVFAFSAVCLVLLATVNSTLVPAGNKKGIPYYASCFDACKSDCKVDGTSCQDRCRTACRVLGKAQIPVLAPTESKTDIQYSVSAIQVKGLAGSKKGIPYYVSCFNRCVSDSKARGIEQIIYDARCRAVCRVL